MRPSADADADAPADVPADHTVARTAADADLPAADLSADRVAIAARTDHAAGTDR